MQKTPEIDGIAKQRILSPRADFLSLLCMIVIIIEIPGGAARRVLNFSC